MQIYMGKSFKNVDFATKIDDLIICFNKKNIKNTIDRSRICIRFAIIENAAFRLIRKRATPDSIGMCPLCLRPTRP